MWMSLSIWGEQRRQVPSRKTKQWKAAVSAADMQPVQVGKLSQSQKYAQMGGKSLESGVRPSGARCSHLMKVRQVQTWGKI